MSTVLDVKGLCAGYGAHEVISDISFSLGAGESLCIAGESGCGKSTLLKSVIGTFDDVRIGSGSIVFDGTSLSELSPKQRRSITSAGMGFVFQNPGASFNPIRSYGRQFAETLKSHGKFDPAEFEAAAHEVFSKLGLDGTKRMLASCPYELSGGMNQRMALALCILTNQKLLLADEPTSALDAAARRTVADELITMRREYGIAQTIVTHDLALAAYLADRIAVMLNGRIVELAPAREIISAPMHPYTELLIKSVPKLGKALPEIGESGAFGTDGELIEVCAGHFVRTEVRA